MPRRPLRRLWVERLEDRVTPTGNILITDPPFGGTYHVKEYTPDGTLVRTLTPPQSDDFRDLIVGPNGDIYLFSGTFSPKLDIYHADSGTWTNLSASNWSTVNNLTYGGVVAWGNYVYVTDMQTASETAPDNGIVRFNLADNSVDRFAAGTDYIEMTLGLDGQLYALQGMNGSGNGIDVYDPATMQKLRYVNAPVNDVRGIAVAGNGEIYAASWYDYVYRLDAAGNFLQSLHVNGGVSDINISTDGKLVLGGVESIMDADFTNIHDFTFGTYHVAFADPQFPPSPPVLAGIEPDTLPYHAGDTDPITGSLTLSQQGTNTISGATVSITAGFTPGEDVLHFTPTFGITGVYDADTGVLRLLGQASVAAYQAALQNVTFNDTNYDPAASTRTVTFQVTGGTADHLLSNAVARDIAVTPHAGPSLAGIEGTALAFTEGEVAAPITTTLTLTDPDSVTLCGGYVYITTGFVAGEDVIGFEETSNIDGDYDGDTGVLTLYGKGTLADYEAALQSVTYQNTSSDPSAVTRTINFWVDDNFPAHHASNIVSRDVTIAAVNTAPVIGVPADGPSGSHDHDITVTGLSVTDPDAEGGVEDLTLSVSHGTIRLLDLADVTIDGGADGSASVTLGGTVAALNAALAGSNLVYHPDVAFNGTETLNLLMTDNDNTGSGGAQTASKSLSITVGPHVAPTLANMESTAIAFTEGDPAAVITGKLTITPGESNTLAGATIAITTGFVSAEDVLAFTNQNGISGSYDPATGILTLTGSASIADYQTALRSVSYQDPSANPTSASRIVTFRVDDGFADHHASNSQARTINVAAVNDAPTLTIPTSGLSGARDHDLAITGISAADVDAGLSSVSLTLSASHGKVGFANLNGLTVTGGANNSATVTVSGLLANLNATLSGGNLIYRPNFGFRGLDSLNVTLNDNGHSGSGGAKTATGAISITITPAAPVLSGIESTALAFTEGNAAKTITAALSIASPDTITLSSATVAITGGLGGGQDVLGFANQNGITGSYNAATGVLTLTGSTSFVAYQVALRSVTYRNTSLDPSNTPRTITFRVDDGLASNSLSNAVSRTVTVAAVNTAPTLTVPTAGPKGTSNTDIAVTGIVPADVDSDGAAERLTLSVAHGALTFANLAGLAVTAGANGSPSMTVQGTLAALNSAVAGGNLIYHSAFSYAGGDTLKLTLTDDGHTGSGLAKSVAKSLAITVTHAAPVLVGIEGTALGYTEGDPATPITAGITISSIDRLTIAGAAVKISSGFAAGQDVLAFTNQNGITGSYNAVAGVLTLSGTTTLANYEAALRTVTYRNTSHDPSTKPRTISFQVRDGFASNPASNIVTRGLTLTAVNTAPTLTLPTAAPKGKHNVDLHLAGIIVADVDADGGVEDLTLSADHGRVRFAKLTGLTIKAGANDSATITVEGTIAQLRAALANGNLIYHSDAVFTGADTLHLDFDDTGNTGIGGPLVVSKSLTIVLT